MKIKRICQWCNKEFEVYASSLQSSNSSGKFCCRKCYNEYQRTLTGKKNNHSTRIAIKCANCGKDWDCERPDISIAFDIAPLVCIWGGNYFADKLPVSNDWLIWHKKNDGLSFSECEMAWTNFGVNCRHISHHWGNEKKQHITMKPLPVIAWAIERAKEKAMLVVDLFGGSGSTLIACEQLDRTCYMMELDPKYCDVIVKRWETLTGGKAKRANVS